MKLQWYKTVCMNTFKEIIAKHNGSVIYVGDSAQLRPVKSDHISKVFTYDGVSQITLTKVERTGDNPILKEATRLRQGEGLSYQTDINDKGCECYILLIMQL